MRLRQRIVEAGRNQAMLLAFSKTVRTEIVLDVGCGIRPQTYFRPRTHICIEPHGPYVDRLMESHGSERLRIRSGTWEREMAKLPDKEVDTVFCLDMIEHLEKEDGLAFLQEADRLARRQVVVFTPFGFVEQDCSETEDRWGFEGNPWQTHRSGWTPADFEGSNWSFVVCRDFHTERLASGETRVFGAFWAFKDHSLGGRNCLSLRRRFEFGLLRPVVSWMKRTKGGRRVILGLRRILKSPRQDR